MTQRVKVKDSPYQSSLLYRHGIKVGNVVEVVEVRITRTYVKLRLANLSPWFDAKHFTESWKKDFRL